MEIMVQTSRRFLAFHDSRDAGSFMLVRVTSWLLVQTSCSFTMRTPVLNPLPNRNLQGHQMLFDRPVPWQRPQAA